MCACEGDGVNLQHSIIRPASDWRLTHTVWSHRSAAGAETRCSRGQLTHSLSSVLLYCAVRTKQIFTEPRRPDQGKQNRQFRLHISLFATFPNSIRWKLDEINFPESFSKKCATRLPVSVTSLATTLQFLGYVLAHLSLSRSPNFTNKKVRIFCKLSLQ